MQIIAWTGGSKPAALSDISPNEKAIVRAIFRDSMREVFSYYGNSQENLSTLKIARPLWKIARYDAHATVRGGNHMRLHSPSLQGVKNVRS